MIIAILLLALALRLINLNQPFWLDEAIGALAVKDLTLQQLFTNYLPSDFNPPFSYLIHFYWGKIFGYSEISLRLPSVIFGVLSIWLIYRLAKLLLPKSKNFPLLASLFLATAPLHIYYSQEARMYSLATFTTILSFWALTSFLKTKQHFLTYIFSTFLTLLSHYLAWFILPAQLLIVYLSKKSLFKKILSAQIISLLLISPWLPTLFKQLSLGTTIASQTPAWSQTVGGTNLKNLLLVFVKFLIGRISIDNNFVYTLVLAIPSLLVIFLFLRVFKQSSKRSLAVITSFSWLILPFLLIALLSLKIPVLSYFRLLFLLPAFYLILALGIISLPKKWRLPVIAFFLVLNLTTASIYLFNQKFHREDWRQLAQTLTTQNLNQSPVIAISVTNAPLGYYSPHSNLVDYLDIDQYLDQPELWLVPYAQPIFYPQLNLEEKLTQAGFQLTFKQHFRGSLTLVKYIKPQL